MVKSLNGVWLIMILTSYRKGNIYIRRRNRILLILKVKQLEWCSLNVKEQVLL
tara:strand:+ start:501 stop:659 length:159 start_codon:yes stop_codon:yes gene_type:complete